MALLSFHSILSGHNCIVSGWGRQASGGATKPDTLQKVNQTISHFIGCVCLLMTMN